MKRGPLFDVTLPNSSKQFQSNIPEPNNNGKFYTSCIFFEAKDLILHHFSSSIGPKRSQISIIPTVIKKSNLFFDVSNPFLRVGF